MIIDKDVVVFVLFVVPMFELFLAFTLWRFARAQVQFSRSLSKSAARNSTNAAENERLYLILMEAAKSNTAHAKENDRVYHVLCEAADHVALGDLPSARRVLLRGVDVGVRPPRGHA